VQITTATREDLPKWLYPALLCGAVLVYWLPRLFRGFWIDEAEAYWVAHSGWNNVWHRIQIWPTQWILYAYLTTFLASSALYKETLLRAPSVAGMLLAAWALYRLTQKIGGPGSGWTAAVPFVCTWALQRQEGAVSPRSPYSLTSRVEHLTRF